MIRDWQELKEFALALGLPEVTTATPWGHETLKAFGKSWCYWSFYENGAVFVAGKEEREMLMQADPETFFLHPHYRNHNLVLVRAGRIDPDWAKARLILQWRERAPKRFLKEWDARDAG